MLFPVQSSNQCHQIQAIHRSSCLETNQYQADKLFNSCDGTEAVASRKIGDALPTDRLELRDVLADLEGLKIVAQMTQQNNGQ